MKKIVWRFLNFLGIGGYIQLSLNGYLKDKGWAKSFHKKMPIDNAGNPIPWMTYPFIYFAAQRLKPHFTVFEYGSGNSTKWFAKQVKSITSVEHDKSWYEIVKDKLPANATLLFRDLANNAYAKSIEEQNQNFDIIIIDGRQRNKCTVSAVKKLNTEGVIIFDNSGLSEYQEAYEFLKNNGFKRLDFEGINPVNHITNITSVFYKSNNCFEI